jgi:hypothetical protein
VTPRLYSDHGPVPGREECEQERIVVRTWFGAEDVTGDEGTPVGITLAVGAVVVVVAAALADRLPVAEEWWRWVVMSIALGVFAAVTVAPVAVTVMLVPTWMIMNGFLVNRSGDLSWHGAVDVDRFLMLTAATAVGLVAGALGRRLHAARDRWERGASIDALVTPMTKETNRSA